MSGLGTLFPESPVLPQQDSQHRRFDLWWKRVALRSTMNSIEATPALSPVNAPDTAVQFWIWFQFAGRID